MFGKKIKREKNVSDTLEIVKKKCPKVLRHFLPSDGILKIMIKQASELKGIKLND